jgi:hypothetical protein
MAFQANDQGIAIDGTGLADGSVSVPTLNRLLVGTIRNSLGPFNGWVNRIWYMPTRQPDYSLPDYTR